MAGVTFSKSMRERAKEDGTALLGIKCVTRSGDFEIYGPGWDHDVASSIVALCRHVSAGKSIDDALDETLPHCEECCRRVPVDTVLDVNGFSICGGCLDHGSREEP